MHTLMTKTAVVAMAALTLTACDSAGTGTKITDPPQNVTYMNFTAEQRAAGTNTITVRTRAVTEENGKKKHSELVGVRCNLLGNGYQANIVTPTKVKVPVYRGATDPVLASCTHNGVDAQKSLEANRIKPKATAPVGLGLGGIFVMAVATAAIDASRNPANDRFQYPSRLNVDFPATSTAE